MSEMNSPEQVVSEISQRITQLEALEGMELKTEMSELKQALRDNPAASSLLRDEDVGLLVASYRKMTGLAITQASAKEKKPRATKEIVKKLSQAELLAALDDPDF